MISNRDDCSGCSKHVWWEVKDDDAIVNMLKNMFGDEKANALVFNHEEKLTIIHTGEKRPNIDTGMIKKSVSCTESFGHHELLLSDAVKILGETENWLKDIHCHYYAKVYLDSKKLRKVLLTKMKTYLDENIKSRTDLKEQLNNLGIKLSDTEIDNLIDRFRSCKTIMDSHSDGIQVFMDKLGEDANARSIKISKNNSGNSNKNIDNSLYKCMFWDTEWKLWLMAKSYPRLNRI